MLENKSDLADPPSQTFIGVRFVLLGFDPINKDKVRSKLVDGGGVDAGQYGPDCTHVIVDKLVYDDPTCVAARSHGKTLVTGLWVDHSFDIGMPVDPSSIMYRPLRDFNGIPGAKSLVVCLTGYQRQDRDDIMTMVSLMGANFLKPLIANKVTHLICYKFEGEKYELAKRMKKIKLVNHRWLEDCLRTWEILPDSNYNKSGYELEMMEAEAKDSEEEPEDMATKQYGGKNVSTSPSCLQNEMMSLHRSPTSVQEIPCNLLDSNASGGLSSITNNTGNMIPAARSSISSVQVSYLRKTENKPFEVSCSHDAGTLISSSPNKPPNLYEKTPSPAKAENDTVLSYKSGLRSHSSPAKLTTISFSRKSPRKTTPPQICSREVGSNLSSSPALNVGGVSFTAQFENSSFKARQKDGADHAFVRTPEEGTDLYVKEKSRCKLQEKVMTDVSSVSSESQRVGYSSKARDLKDQYVGNRTEGLEPAPLVRGSFEKNNCRSPGHNACYAVDTVAGGPASASLMISTKASSFLGSKSTGGSETVYTETRQDGNVDEALQASFLVVKNGSLTSETHIKDVGISTSHQERGNVVEPPNDLQAMEATSPRAKKLKTQKSSGPDNSLKGGNLDSDSKPLRGKMTTKKFLGSRQSFGKGGTTNHKGSIYLKTAVEKESITGLSGGKEMPGHKKSVHSKKIEMVSPETRNEVKMTVLMDDETETPVDKVEGDEMVVGEEKSDGVEQAHIVTTDKSKSIQDTINNTGRIVGVHDHSIGESTRIENAAKEERTKRKKCPLSKTKKNISTVKKILNSEDGAAGEGAKIEKKNKIETKEGECISIPAGKTYSTVAVNKSKNSIAEGEKENWPLSNEDQNATHGEQRFGKEATKCSKIPAKISVKAGEMDLHSVQKERAPGVKIEPAWFILTGHKLQRKEFQKVIKGLKGKVCRDSHQWSYQATHFIVPDPIRRIEKFFAAAASGRWILKTDYLTASRQAGKFLAEEPYEWHKNGLSEDGAINLEAPRKWRLLRERTGHGAFYGMHIVIYGECIAPPLDTLKRVVKAGDGTILATSPPYTRFLDSGVDFAIVSPGMPRVDMWVQEFLRHEIPCVLADYLVDYVCKPGYSLERHVQYSTHAWAERSLKNLVNRLDEVVEDLKPQDSDDSDLMCAVCGSGGRGDLMLICGNENGSVGCGVGTHIDCCDPPLEAVPKEDWFCPKCSESRNKKKPRKTTKKKRSLL